MSLEEKRGFFQNPRLRILAVLLVALWVFVRFGPDIRLPSLPPRTPTAERTAANQADRPAERRAPSTANPSRITEEAPRLSTRRESPQPERAQPRPGSAASTEALHLQLEERLRDLGEHDTWQPRSVWQDVTGGETVTVKYTAESWANAATVIHRLRTLQAEVRYELVLEWESRGRDAQIEYPFHLLDAATAIQAALIDMLRFDLESSGRSGTLTVWVK